MVEADLGHNGEPFDNIEHELGENSGGGVGEITVPLPRNADPNELLTNPESLAKHPQLQSVVDSFHNAGQEVFGYWNAHRGIVLTVLGSAAVAAGAVGIGVLIKRREHKEEHKNNETI